MTTAIIAAGVMFLATTEGLARTRNHKDGWFTAFALAAVSFWTVFLVGIVQLS